MEPKFPGGRTSLSLPDLDEFMIDVVTCVEEVGRPVKLASASQGCAPGWVTVRPFPGVIGTSVLAAMRRHPERWQVV